MAVVLYGPDGLPIDRSRLLVEQAAPSLASVRNIAQEHPAEGLTPRRLAQLLRDSEAGDARAYLELAEDMEERDPHYLGVLGKRKRGVSQLEMTVVPASSSGDDKAAADLVRSFLDRLELQGEVFDILDAVGKGFSVTEILWETSARQWMPRALKWRDPRWFRFSLADGETLEMWDNAGFLPLAPYQFVVHRAPAKSGLPIRGGLARAVAWCYLFKNFDLKSWVTFADVYGQPIRIGRYGPGASDADKQALLSAVRNIAQDCAAIIPQSMAIELVEAKMTGNTDLFQKLVNYLDQQVSKAVLGNTATTDAIAGGHAVGRVHRDVEQDIQRADARALEVTVNRDLVRPIVDLNMGPRPRYPIVRIVVEDQQDILQAANAIAALVDRGLQVSQSAMRRRLGIDEPQPGDPVLVPAHGGGLTPSLNGGMDAALSANAQLAPAPKKSAVAAPPGPEPSDGIDRLVAEQLADWEAVTAPLLRPVQDLAAQCRTMDEFLVRLPTVLPRQRVDALTERLAQALFAARLAGETGVDIAGDAGH